MTQENNFPSNLQLQARAAHIDKVLMQDRKAAIADVSTCKSNLQDAVARLDDLQSKHSDIVSKISTVRQQQVAEGVRIRSERDTAQAKFDLAMKSDDEAKQVAAAKVLSNAEMGVEHAKLLGPDALRLRAMEAQESASLVDVENAKEEVDALTERLHQAEYQAALVDYDEAIGVGLKKAIRIWKANMACKKRHFMNGFEGSSIWIGSGHRVISHLQCPNDQPVNIGGYYFMNLMNQGIDTDL